jgi:hypothetical protein
MIHLLRTGLAGLFLTASPMAIAQAGSQDEWNGLRKVVTKKFDEAQLLPGFGLGDAPHKPEQPRGLRSRFQDMGEDER